MRPGNAADSGICSFAQVVRSPRGMQATSPRGEGAGPSGAGAAGSPLQGRGQGTASATIDSKEMWFLVLHAMKGTPGLERSCEVSRTAVWLTPEALFYCRRLSAAGAVS